MTTIDNGDGTFTDTRDAKTYRMVRIGNFTWMAENLNFVTDSSVCYENDESNCQKYGRLYNWNEAMKACPAPWRVPSDAEWTALTDFVGGEKTAGTKLKSETGWSVYKIYKAATDEYGFSALPGGGRWSDGNFGYAGNLGFWWSATERGADGAWRRDMSNRDGNMGRHNINKTLRFSVRCLQDSAPKNINLRG